HDRSETSNVSTRRAPLRPANSRDHVASTPQASGVTRPNPVMTTRRMRNPSPAAPGRLRHTATRLAELSCRRQRHGSIRLSSRVRVLLKELDRVADRQDVLGGIIRDLAAELLLEGHHQLDGIEAVRAEIVDEG